MRTLYLLLAIAGAVIPLGCFFEFFMSRGFSLPLFFEGIFANGAATGFAADLFISSFVFWLFMFSQRSAGGPGPWLFIALNLCIGLSCALPAYLYALSARAPEADATTA